MKKLLLVMTLFSISATSMAITYEKGDGSTDVHPRLLRKALIQGKTNINGMKIVLKEGLSVPPKYQKKWDEIKLSGGEIPSTGSVSANTLMITGF